MGYGYFEDQNEGGGGFLMGLLAGTIIGAGFGLLFAPKGGSELRGQLSDQANNWAEAASDGYRRARHTASDLMDKGIEMGRQMQDRARTAVARGTEEAERYARAAGDRADAFTGDTPRW